MCSLARREPADIPYFHFSLYMEGGRSIPVWNTLQHNGVYFPPPYDTLPEGVIVSYNKQPLVLSAVQEEALCLLARTLASKPDLASDRTFTKNFLKDFRAYPGKKYDINDMSLLNLSKVRDYLTTKPKGSERPDLSKYETCVVDGKKQPVSNFKVEPPGIFIGMGSHPMRGRIKKRISPEDVVINISKSATTPKPNVPGRWGKVIEDRTVTWIASWRQNVTGKLHHVWLGQESTLQMNRDKEKYDLARKLSLRIDKIRTQNEEALRSASMMKRQLGTAVWIIDHLAIRVGNEKGENEAQTVGVTSLLVRHVKIEGRDILRLDFLGKDSVPYSKTLSVPSSISSNLETFLHKKDKDDMVFDKIDSKAVNEYLQSLMKGLTAKVFRTMNSSRTFQDLLREAESRLQKGGTTIQDVFREYNMANVSVAELCNHQKKISASSQKIAQQYKERIAKAKTPKRKKDLKEELRLKKAMKNLNLSTSRQNYLDPRITVAFAKRMKVPMSKFFSKKLLAKFKWALDIEEEFVW